MPEEFWPHRGAALETRLNHLENWACQLGKRSPSVLGQRMSTAGGAVTGVPASAPGSPTWLLDGDVTGPPTGNTATRCVVLSPGSAGRNTIQPTAITAEAMTLKRIAGQTAPYLQWATETGTVQGLVTATGHLMLGNPAISPVFDAVFQVHGQSTGAFFSPDCNTTYLCQVDPVDHSWFGAIFFQGYNPLAGTPAAGFFQLTAYGRYDNAGLRSDYGFDITDGITNQNAVQFEGGPQQRVAFGLMADTFLPMLYDGQVDIQSRTDTTKTLTLRPFSPTATAHQQEWQSSASAVLSYVTPSAGFVIGPGAAGAGLAPWKLTSGTLQTTAEAGAFEFLTPTFSATPVTTRRALSLASNPITADVTVANTVTETLLFTGTVAANEMGVGKVLRVSLYGRYSALITDSFTLRLKQGGTTFLTITSALAALTNAFWKAEFILTCRTTGAAGTVESDAYLISNNLVQSAADTGTHTVDSTAAQNLTATIQWGAASVSDTLTLAQGLLEVLD